MDPARRGSAGPELLSLSAQVVGIFRDAHRDQRAIPKTRETGKDHVRLANFVDQPNEVVTGHLVKPFDGKVTDSSLSILEPAQNYKAG